MYDLVRELYNRTYTFLPVMCFKVVEKVEREVYAPQFRDRIVSIFLYDLLSSLVEPEFIDDSYSCREGKGTSYGIRRLEHHIRSVSDNFRKPCLIMKYDITGYFMSIRHDILERVTLERIERGRRRKDRHTGRRWEVTVDIEYVIWLTKLFIHRNIRDGCIILGDPRELDSIPDSKRLSKQPEGQGIIIGDCCSQLFSNIIGDCIDQYMKRALKRKHYGRYVDDFYDIDTDHKALEQTRDMVETFMKEELGLTLHAKKTRIYTSLEGVEFIGGYIKPGRIYAGKSAVRNFSTTARDITTRRKNTKREPTLSEENAERQLINSYTGYLSQFNSFNIRQHTIHHGQLDTFFTFNERLTKTTGLPITA